MTNAQSDTMAVGTRLVELCRAGENLAAIDALYSPDIVSVEPGGCTECERVMEGIDAIRAKNRSWFEDNEVHGAELEGPFPSGDRFVVSMKYDMTPKAGPMAGNRFTMHEMGVYTVSGGKIVREEFFYEAE